MVASTHSSPLQTLNPVLYGGPTLIEIDAAHRRGPVSGAKNNYINQTHFAYVVVA